jgi:hypothetical protein
MLLNQSPIEQNNRTVNIVPKSAYHWDAATFLISFFPELNAGVSCEWATTMTVCAFGEWSIPPCQCAKRGIQSASDTSFCSVFGFGKNLYQEPLKQRTCTLKSETPGWCLLAASALIIRHSIRLLNHHDERDARF